MTQIAPTQQAPVNTPPSPSSASLYVGDLQLSVDEAQLFELFNQVGPVLSIKVCRDLMTKKSLGYAYVNYINAQDAANAIELLNFSNVNGKPIRIMYSRRDPSMRKSGTANIFIKNLDKSLDNKALHDTFSVFGPILSCRIAMDCNGISKGYGFVQFEQEEAAQTAIEKVNGMLINDKQVFVGPFMRRQERDLALSGTSFNNVFVKNLVETTSDEDLRKEFEGFGPISSAVVMRDSHGKSKGFGFVNFENADDAAKAVEGLNGKNFGGKEWYVGRAQKKSEREVELKTKFEQLQKERVEKSQGVNLYLKNLEDNYDDEKLMELFSPFGTITSCKVMRGPSGQSKGSGFVAFSSPDEASCAVAEMNGKMVGSKPLYVAIAERKEERQARLQAQFEQMRNITTISPPGTAGAVPMYHAAPPGLSHRVFYGQPHLRLISPQPTSMGYPGPMVPGMRSGAAQVSNHFMSSAQRSTQQAQRFGNNRRMPALPQQPPNAPPVAQQLSPQVFPSGSNRDFQHSPPPRMPDGVSQEFGGLDMSGVSFISPGMGYPVPINALASALASAPPKQQRLMLGEQLYPLVDQLEHSHAGKVTGMLLELDQPEVLHLIESPEALEAKVAEAIEVLKSARTSAAPTGALDELSSLSLSEPLTS